MLWKQSESADVLVSGYFGCCLFVDLFVVSSLNYDCWADHCSERAQAQMTRMGTQQTSETKNLLLKIKNSV
jgi:hypothetical protein